MLTTTNPRSKDLVEIPAYAQGDLESFRAWAHSKEFPEHGRISYLNGVISVDLSMEQLFSHNQIRTEIAITLGGLVKSERLGRFITDGMRLSNIEADFSQEPDSIFVSHESMAEGRVQLIEGKEGGYVELEGTPDMVLEIVSNSSVVKDTQTLKAAYAQAGIPEYWLIDARGEILRFEIFRNTSSKYVSVKKQAVWLKSAAFGKSFKLTAMPDDQGNPEFTLEIKS